MAVKATTTITTFESQPAGDAPPVLLEKGRFPKVRRHRLLLRLALRPEPLVPGADVLARQSILAIEASVGVPRVVGLAPRAAQERLFPQVRLQRHSGGLAGEPRLGGHLVLRRLAGAVRTFEVEKARQPPGHQRTTARRCAEEAGRVRFFDHS